MKTTASASSCSHVQLADAEFATKSSFFVKKVFLNCMLLLCALIVGSSSLWATDEVYYTLTPEKGSDNGYASAEDIEIDDVTWNVKGNSTLTPWRIGGKSLSSVDRAVYSKTAMGAAITEVKLTVGAASSITVNSLKLIVSTEPNGGGTKIDEVSATFAANSTISFKPTSPATQWAKDAYYKFVFNVTVSGNSNKFVEFKDAEFYTPETAKTDPTITFNNGSVRVGKSLNLGSLISSDSDGAVTYSITEGGSYASIDGTTLTGSTVGSVTVQASQAATLSYNAKVVTATISVVDPDLSSIAITTAPTKKTYDEGDLFDATGMAITATFADESTEDVTASCTWEPSRALATTDDKVTISYTYNAVTKTATQAITVNPYVQPTDVTINLSNTLFGISAGNNPTEQSTDVDKVTITTGCESSASSKTYYASDHIRFYADSYLTLEAPSGFVITGISLNRYNTATWNGNKVTPSTGAFDGTPDESTAPLVWSGAAATVRFDYTAQCRTASVDVTLAESKDVTITVATWASFSCASALDFTGTGVTAYIAKAKDGESVILSPISKVPANTGIVVNAAAGTYAIPVLSVDAEDVTGNLLHAWLTAGTPSEDSYYTLAIDNNTDKNPVFKKSSGGVLAAGKAYLVPSGEMSAPSIIRVVDEENNATSIESIEASDKAVKFIENGRILIKKNGIVYDALGRIVK